MRAACALAALAALAGLGGALAQPTEVWIGALYPVLKPSGGSTSQDCGGTNRMEAFMMAKDQFNDKTDGSYDAALPDTTVKFIYRDSKRSSEYAVSGATGHMMKRLGPNCETTGECYSVAAIIGPASSGPTMSAQTVLREYGIPQISFSATSPSLANNAAYPTFMRTPPSDAYQAEKTADLMKNVFGWDCVNTVSGTDSYSTAGMKAFKSSAEKVGVRVDYSLTVSSSDSTLKDQVEQMFASTQCAINLLWAQGYDMGRFIGEMYRGNFYGTKEYILWISESGYANAATMLDYSKLSEADFFKVIKGAVMAYYEDLKIKDSAVWQKHKDVWLSLPVPAPTGTGVVVGDATFTAKDNVCLSTTDDIGVPLYQWDHDQDPSTPNVCAKFNCNADVHTESSFGGYVAYSYDASVTIMQAIDDLIKSGKRQCQYDEYVGIDPKTGTCFTGLDLYTQMTKQDFMGTTNRVHYVTSGSGVGQRGEGVAMALFVYTATEVQSWKPVGMVYDTFDPTVCDDPKYSSKCTDDFIWPDGTTGLANKPVSTVPKKKTCQPGLYINSEGVCTKCPTGKKLEAAGPHTRTECEICPAGTYAPATGMTECLGCESVSGYQPEAGKDACLLCPANSYRVIGSDPTNDEGCMCMAGYYQVREAGLLKCVECPFGMECLGEKYVPFAKPGYYAISDLEAMFCLRNTDACAGGGLVGAKTNNSATAKIDITRCAGNFVGNMCSQCQSGYFNVGNTCAECTGGGGVIAFWIAILVFIIGSSQVGRYLMVTSNKSLQKAALGFAVLVMLPSFKVLVAFFQMMALLVMTEGISWPRQALDAISWTDFFNVDTGVLQVPCVFKDIATDELQRKIVLSLPWFSILVVVLAVVISAAVAASKGQAAFGEFVTLYFKSLFSGNKTRVPEAAVGLSSVSDALVALFVMFSWIVYLPVMIETVSLLTCSTFGNLTTKRSFVLSYPYIECTAGNPEFDEVRTWGLGCLFCYGFGIPAILYAMLRTSKGNFTDPAVYRRLAPAFFEYKPEFRYYQLVIMLRLFALSMCATLASTKLRLYYFSIIIIITIASHMYFQPYNTMILNVMETTALLTLGLVAQVAYVFISEELVESTQTDSIGVFLAVLLVLCILLIVTTFVMDFKAAYANAVIRLAVTDQDETTAAATLFPATESGSAVSGKEATAVMNMVKFHFQRCETNQTSTLSGDDITLRGTAAGLAIETGATGVLGPRGTAALGGAKSALADSMITQQFFDEVMSHAAAYPLCMSEMLKPEVSEGVLQSLVYSDDADRKAIIETMQSLGSMLSALAEDGAATEIVSKTTGVSGVNKDMIPSVLDFMQFCGSADQTASLIESIKSRCQGADAVKKNSKVSPGV